MNIFLYAIIFMCGAMFGSFYTLAVYRIPKNIDIVKKHSFCPNCNHKLGVLELIPILSYIFLGGKCKNCKQKIRPRYLILEILSGCAFVILAYALGLDVYTLSINNAIVFGFTALYFTAIVLIASIDKEYRNINKKVLAYGIIISLAYMIYLYTIDPTSIYRYAIYLAVYVILLTTDTFLLRRYAEESYLINLIMYFNLMLTFVGYRISAFTILIFTFEIILHYIISKLKQSKNGNKPIKLSEISLGFYLGAANIMAMFSLCIVNILTNSWR